MPTQNQAPTSAASPVADTEASGTLTPSSGPVARWVLPLIFLGAIAAPLLTTLFNIASGVGSAREESRAATPRLGTSFAELRALPGAAKWYFTERFGLKESLVYLHGLIEVKLLKTSSSSAVLLGHNDRLFLASERVLDYQRGAEPLTDAQLSDWTTTLEQRRRSLAEQNIRYAFVVAPNSHTIYPEDLPDDLAKPGRNRLDQLVEAAKSQAPEVCLIDLRPTLFPYKDQVPLYFKTDTHWSPAAGFLAAREIAARLQIQPPQGELLPVRELPVAGGDLARLLGLADSYADKEVWPAATPLPLKEESGAPLTVTLADVISRPRIVALNPAGQSTALIFRDSFGEALVPWLSGMFEKTIWIWSYEFSEELVQREKPQFVIEQLVERKLMTIRRPGGGVGD